ncbi:MAG: SDR family oxidoreductase [Rhodobacteraceae bacterium]|nr:SDR family oxidoreductase [Paracoccaceae bacterium]
MSKILFIGGTGTISLACVNHAVAKGHDVSVFNRGKSGETLPEGVRQITGDLNDDTAYAQLASMGFDSICQFLAFTPGQVERDIRFFAGHTGQYLFISSASAYEKPVDSSRVTEKTPLINPHWQYSRDKAACEELITAADIPSTIVRPSHTMRHKLPNPFGDEGTFIHRLRAGKPIIVQGDGTSLWTLTKAEDFAIPFVGLLANSAAINEIFHITGDVGFTWNAIVHSLAKGMGLTAKLQHVASDALTKFDPEFEGSLLGDKSHCALFDNSKVKRIGGDFQAETDLDKILAGPVAGALARYAGPNAETDALYDRIVAWSESAGNS